LSEKIHVKTSENKKSRRNNKNSTEIFPENNWKIFTGNFTGKTSGFALWRDFVILLE
jgi:hypothetical protein